MLLPYRAKNPPEHFPYVTIGLIIVNTLVFALTSEMMLTVHRDIVHAYALSWNTMSLLRLFTSMFLHGSLLHLVGNMLFLWLFGASLEGRLGPLKFIALYLLAGLGGSLLHEGVMGVVHPEQFSLGASGAIMGLGGAYLFVFPFSSICVFYLWGIGFMLRAGVTEWQARWVVLLYISLDVLEACLLQGGDGVAHLAHIGGFGVGLLTVFLMRARRDSEEMSAVQATRADLGRNQDFSLLHLSDLETILEHPTEDMRPVMAYCDRTAARYNGQPDRALAMLRRYSAPLMEQADAQWLAQTLLFIPPSYGGLPGVYYLRLASKLERMGSNDLAGQLYRRIYEINPSAPDVEAALFRHAQMMRNVYQNNDFARSLYVEQLRLFPHGPLALQAEQNLRQTALPGG